MLMKDAEKTSRSLAGDWTWMDISSITGLTENFTGYEFFNLSDLLTEIKAED